MSHFRNIARLVLLTLIILSSSLLSLNSSEAKSGHAAASAGHRAPNTLDTQATFIVTNADDGGAGSLRIAIGSANIGGGPIPSSSTRPFSTRRARSI